jgi:hypothetical protein
MPATQALLMSIYLSRADILPDMFVQMVWTREVG